METSVFKTRDMCKKMTSIIVRYNLINEKNEEILQHLNNPNSIYKLTEKRFADI